MSTGPETSLIPVVAERSDATDAVAFFLERLHPEWHSRAACVGKTDIMFPDKGGSAARAVAICDRCPVHSQCAEQARVGRESDGVWAGVSLGRGRSRSRGGRASNRDAVRRILANGQWRTAGDVAAQLGVARESAGRTLGQLADRGEVERRTVGDATGPRAPKEYRLKDTP